MNGICENGITPRRGFGFPVNMIRSALPYANDHKAFSLFNFRFSILFLFTIFFAAPISAQKSKPDKLFENKQYYAAAQAFEKEVADGKTSNLMKIFEKIGICYLKINQPQKAVHWLQSIIDNGSADADTWFLYGLALQQTADYHKAKNAFKQCLQIQTGHPMAPVKIESCQFAITNSQVNPYTDFRLATEVNTAGGEFGMSLYANNVIYFSLAAEPVVGAKIDQRTGLQYVEASMTRIRGKRLLFPQLADNTLPKFVNEGLFTYDSLARCVYFSYCDPNNNRCGIYTSKLTGGKWTDPEIILQNKKNQITGHPAIANGGNRLYFTFMSDGTGQTDIWYMDKLSDTKWGQPVSAGNTINTFGREEFPFVYADTLLFFASDGHVGYGGLDIFCSVVRGNTFSPPVNLHRPFNSPGDDFNLIISGQMGLLSSSRNEMVSDDIYIFSGLPSFRYLHGTVTDNATGVTIRNARLSLSVNGTAVQETVSDSTGYYGLFLRENETPMLYVRATGYKISLTDLPKTGTQQFTDFPHDVQLNQSTILPASIQIYNKNSGIPVSERGIICSNNDGEEQILRTDASGSFKLLMQEDQREYWIKFPDGMFMTESIILNNEQKSYSLAVQPLDGKLFTGWLLFKRGSMEATEMSQALIPRIASVIKANPGMVFLIEGFCDAGFEVNQQHLAIQRAEYIVRRLIDEKVDPRQISALAGAPKTDTTIEDEADQRRVEIKIKK